MGTVKLLIFIVALLLATINAATDDEPKVLEAVIRDQVPSSICSDDYSKCGDAKCIRRDKDRKCVGGFDGTDFQPSGYKDDELGLAGFECWANGTNIKTCGQLISEEDPTPKYRFSGESPWKNIKSPDSFNKWFHNSNQTINVPYTLPLSPYRGVFRFNSEAFFPIDGKGWKDYATDGKHNFGFCMEAHTRFGYTGGEIFYFSGDDDVWVYINNYLVIDLGSLHPKRTKNLDLDSVADAIGLEKKKSYRLDFFYCERHTPYSNLQLTTSLDLYCSYTDQCGVCEGTGQSCCVAGSCDDRNACTDDYCDVKIVGKCTHKNTTCPISNKCKEAFCNTKTGCGERDLVCNDGDLCTTDSCNPSGGCFYSAPCPDKGKCQVGACQGKDKGCTYSARTCPTSSDKCQIPVCTEANGCGFVQNTCDDSDPCTIDSCDSKTGCKNVPACNDNDACTTDTCAASNGKPVCSFKAKCTNGNKCWEPKCDPKIGVCSLASIPCQTDSCHVAVCSNTTGCQNKEKICDDGNACTRDTCDPKTPYGCVFTDITSTCNDGNACTKDSCDKITGCVNAAISFDDGDACTKDSCDPLKGIIHDDITPTCNDNNLCTIDSCEPKTGCVNKKKICDDKNSCTTDYCDSSVKVEGQQCKATAITGCVTGCTKPGGGLCVADDACYPATCTSATVCSNTTVNCDDSSECTKDSCSGGACQNAPITCTARNPCETASCDKTKGCVYTPISCDDKNPCTEDKCDATTSYKCSNVLKDAFCTTCNNSACAYSDPCNPKVCENNKCVTKQFDCNDNNACTDPRCSVVDGKASCSYTDTQCASSSDLCKPNVCDPKIGCQATPTNCTSSDLCVVGKCSSSTGTCTFDPIECDNEDPCRPQVCRAGKCVEEPIVCDDGIACTKDQCIDDNGKANCIAINDCGFDKCGQMSCNGTSCAAFIPPCDDGNPCTTDGYECADGNYTCTYTPSGFCDDQNACTNDFCDAERNITSPCSSEEIKCLPRNICEVVPAIGKCDNKTGCVYQPILCSEQDPNRCKVWTCDPRAGGCIAENYICPAPSDGGCFKSVCNPNASLTEDPCSIVKKDNWGSRESTNGILCALRYDDTIRNAAIGTGAAVGIGIGAAAAAGFIGYGGKKGYDHWKNMQNQRFNGVQNNPLYETSQGASDNPLYRHSTTL